MDHLTEREIERMGEKYKLVIKNGTHLAGIKIWTRQRDRRTDELTGHVWVDFPHANKLGARIAGENLLKVR